MSRSRVLLIIALIITIIYATVSKVYEKRDGSVKTIVETETIIGEHTTLNTGEEKYEAKVYLNSEDKNLNAIVELCVISKVWYDKEKGRYVLDEPVLNINPVGCTIVEVSGNKVTGTEVSGYYRILLKKNQEFESDMTVATGRELLRNTSISNLKVVKPLDSNINSIDLLKKSTLENEKIRLNYINKGEAFDMWFEISFFLDANNNGQFKIF